MYKLIKGVKQIFIKNYTHKRELNHERNHENNKTHKTLTKKTPQEPRVARNRTITFKKVPRMPVYSFFFTEASPFQVKIKIR